jgi:protein-tyrosine kinase
MESITQALQRAKTEPGARPLGHSVQRGFPAARHGGPEAGVRAPIDQSQGEGSRAERIRLDQDKLQANRIVAFDSALPQTRHYDILRNQLLDHKQEANRHVIAVTSPNARCGTSVTALNLALSLARIKGRVLIIDAHARNPCIGYYLGLERTAYAASGGTAPQLLRNWVQIGGAQLSVLRPASTPVTTSSEHERSMLAAQIEAILPGEDASVVVIDLPPMLESDETLPLIQNADSVVLVLATGHSKLSDLDACKTYLRNRPGVQVVLNKSAKHGF